jgi:antitoxin component of MazEF toxin-antitoxin module
MELLIGEDGAIILTAEMLSHLGLKAGDRLSVTLAADRHLELVPIRRAPGETLLKSMLNRTKAV